GRTDQLRSRRLPRLPDRLLVAGEQNRQPGAIENARALQPFERRQDHHDPTFHVARAWSGGSIAAANELLKRAGGFEHRVHVTDEENTFAAISLSLADEVRPALYRIHRNPTRGEAQTVELGLQEFADRGDARRIEGPRIGIHQLFE